MRRAISLLAFGATLFTASAELGLGTIKAVSTSAVNKDSWSVKGATISDAVSFSDLEDAVELGLDMDLLDSADDVVDTVEFEPEDCKFLRNEQGVVCRIKGARLSIKLFTSTTRTKAAAGASIESKNKTSTGKDGLETTTLTFWKVTAFARRRSFEESLTEDGLTLELSDGALRAVADDCEEKTLAHGQTRLTCVPVEEED